MKPVLHIASDTNDPFLSSLVACIKSIACAEHFTDHLGKIQTEQASVVQRFQKAVSVSLAAAHPQMQWSLEHQQNSGSKDAVDIFGTSTEALVVIELDKNRADQVAKKFVSRSAIFKDKKIYYISLCYPGTDRMSVGECIKYFGYCANLSQRLGNVYAGFVIQQT
jgi:hypothetical protein